MIEFMGKKFLTTKEASKRYGRSVQWFDKRRMNKLKPTYMQITERGSVLYPEIETDSWFKKQIQIHIGG